MYIPAIILAEKDEQHNYPPDSKIQWRSMTRLGNTIDNSVDLLWSLQQAVQAGDNKLAKQIVDSGKFKSKYDVFAIKFDNFTIFEKLFKEKNYKKIKLILNTFQTIGILKKQLLQTDDLVLRFALDCGDDKILKLILNFYHQAKILSMALFHAVSSKHCGLAAMILNNDKNRRLSEVDVCDVISDTLLMAAERSHVEMINLILNQYNNAEIVSMALNKGVDECDYFVIHTLLKQYKIAGIALDDVREFKQPKLSVDRMIANLFEADSIKPMVRELYRFYNYLAGRSYVLHYSGGEPVIFQGKSKKVPRNINLVLFEYDEFIDDINTLDQCERLRDRMLQYCIDAADNPPSYVCGVFHPRDTQVQSLYNWISDAALANSNGALIDALN